VTDPNPDFRELLGSYYRVIATCAEGMAALNVAIIEAFESGDIEYARELVGVADQNLAHWRKTFGFSKDIP
jgi:hypothetical protein